MRICQCNILLRFTETDNENEQNHIIQKVEISYWFSPLMLNVCPDIIVTNNSGFAWSIEERCPIYHHHIVDLISSERMHCNK